MFVVVTIIDNNLVNRRRATIVPNERVSQINSQNIHYYYIDSLEVDSLGGPIGLVDINIISNVVILASFPRKGRNQD